ncbi:MAG: fluoride efflux transporter CrcB [Tannerella sp.]|jgi:CrcB protein|nr:fluoride efflux transporter CrcB [Tannerella sp.]
MFRDLLLVGLGGGAGSMLRYASSLLAGKMQHTTFPVGTLFVNIAGCFILGLVVAFLERQQVLNANLRLLLITGFCGGFTTFSAFSSESLKMFGNGHYFLAITYILVSVILGLLAVWGGMNAIEN